MMHTMMRGGVQNPFERPKSFDVLCMDPKLIDEIKHMYGKEHPRRKPKQHYRCIEHPVKDPGKPALTNGNAQVVLFAGVVNDMKIPKEPCFVTNTVKDIVREIIDEEQNDP